MAKVQCKGCGQEVDTSGIACPNCGTPIGYSGGTPVDYDQIRASAKADQEQAVPTAPTSAPPTPRCMNCGTIVSGANVSFCPSCGKPVGRAAPGTREGLQWGAIVAGGVVGLVLAFVVGFVIGAASTQVPSDTVMIVVGLSSMLIAAIVAGGIAKERKLVHSLLAVAFVVVCNLLMTLICGIE